MDAVARSPAFDHAIASVVHSMLSPTHCLLAEKNDLEYAVPGGLIGVGTQMDPTLTRAGA